MRVDDRVGLARDRRTVRVADRDHLGVLLPRVTDGHERVGRLARLGDRHDERGRGDDRVAVAELRGDVDLARNVRPVLDRVLRDHPRVERGPTGHDDDLVDPSQLCVVDVDLVEHQSPVRIEAPEQCVRDGARLLEDLLAHEPVVAALLGRREVPVDVVRLRDGRFTGEARHVVAVRSDLDDLVLTELDGLSRVLDERRDVGRDEHLALAHADHERRVAAGSHDPLGRLGIHRDKGERTLESVADRAHRLDERSRTSHLATEQLGRDLGVGLTGEDDAVRLQLRAQRSEVLDDAVVYDRDPAALRGVRVGIAVRRTAVCGPARMADALRRGRQRVLAEFCHKVRELARLLDHHEPGVCDDGDARGVVPAVFHPSQTADHDVLSWSRAHVPDDSAHAEDSTCRRLLAQAVPSPGRRPRSEAGRRSGSRCATSRSSSTPAERRCHVGSLTG